MGKFLDSVKNKKVDNNKNTTTSTQKVGKFGKSVMESKIGFDTIDSDLKALGTTVDSIYKGWQPQETITNTKSTIASMQERLNAYQEYAKLFGGEDVTELAKGYQTALADLDNLAATYGKFKTAEDYTKAEERRKSLPTADLKAVETEVADLETQLTRLKGQKDQFVSKSGVFGGFVPTKYDKQIKDLESKLADRQAFYEDAKSTQETLATIQKETAMASDPNNMESYNQYIANYEAERVKEAVEKAKTPWWVDAIGNIGGSGDILSDTVKTVVKNKQEDKTWQLPQGEWTDDEKRVLGGYFMEDPQKAIDYVVKKNNEKAKAKQGETEKVIQGSATSNVGTGALHTVGAVLTAPFGLADYLDDVTDKIAGRPIIEESMVTPFEYSQAVTSGVSTHLNDLSGTLNENIPVLGGKGLGDVYGLGTSVLQSATSAYTLGGVGTLISYFGQGAAAGVDDALSRGATDDQALAYGFVLGAAEGISENIGAERLLNLGSPNEIRKILVNGFKKGGGKEFWSLVDKQGKAEALEELFSGIAGQVADNWIMQGKSNFDALTKEYRALGMSATEANKKAWVQSIGDVAFDALSGYLSGAVHAGPQIAVSAAKQKAENKTLGKEIRGNDRVTDMLSIASLSPQESDALEAYNQYAKRGVNAENITDAQLGNLYGMAETEAVSTLRSKKATTEQKADAETTYNRLSKMKTENKEAKLAKELAQTDEEGNVTPTTREMVINEQAKGMGEAETDLFRLVDDGQSNAGDYADSFNLVVAMAQNEYDQDYILEHRGVLSTAQVDSIYKAVVTNPKMAQQKRLNALIQEQGDNLEIKGTIDDSVIDYGNTGAEGKVNWKDLHPNVKATIAYVSGFATKVAGMDVQLVTNGRDYGFTGRYDRQGNAMLVDITALTERVKSADSKGRKDNARFIISTVAHEVTHWMEEKAPELYAQYDKMVMDALTAGGLTEAGVLARRRALLERAEAKRAKKENRKPREITDKEVRREVIARASEDMLALSEEGKKFFESLTENEQKQFVDKIKEVIQNIKDWIKTVLSKLTSDAPEARELRALAQDLDAISKKWDEMLRQAAKTNAAMKKAGVKDNDIVVSERKNNAQNSDISEEMDYNNWESYEVTDEFVAKVPFNERHAFLRSLANKTNGMKQGKLKNIVIFTDKHVYFYSATGYMNGNIEEVSRLSKTTNAKIKEWRDSSGDTSAKTFDSMAQSYGSRRRRDDWDNVANGYTKETGRLDDVDEQAQGSDTVGYIGESAGDFSEDEDFVTGSLVYTDDGRAFRVNDGGTMEDIQYSDIDTEYMDAVENGDMETAQKLVYEAAQKAGYTNVSSWRMQHTAPNSKSDVSLANLKSSGLVPDDYWSHPEWYTYSAEERESFYKVKKAVETQERREAEGNPRDARMWVYRAVDKTVNSKEDYFRNGDWVTPSYDYAVNEGKMNPNGYRVIKHSVSIKDLYWDGNSIAELGYDDGNAYAYADTLNNRKLLAPVTYDDVGNVIPLSKRFKRRNWDVRYSDIDESFGEDSEGRKLSAEQQEFFKNSSVRDETGKLKVMYHGTPNAGFTKFRSGTYFTEHKWYAERYKERSASSLRYKPTADNPDVYAVYLNIQKPFDTRNLEEARIFNEEYLGHYGMGTPLMESGLPDWLDGMDLQEFLEEQGYDYDGLILDEGKVGGYGDEVISRGLSYVVFSPEQVKNIDNATPTNDPDIRYSDIDELDDLNAQLKEKQNQIYSATMELRKFDVKAEEEKLYAVMNKEGVSKEELDKALQDFSNWGKESGYAEAHEKQSALKDEERLLRREIQKVEDRLHDELKEQIAHWDDEEVKKYVAKAVRKYHTTTRLDKASYLVTTGSMLDFSDGQGYRVKDHREISEILDLPDYAEYSDGMIAFMNMGNIRLQTYGIDVSAMPNAKQFSTLRDIIFKVMRENDEFSVDFSKTDGNSAGSVTYGKGTSASKIIADIKSYFETGIVPEEQSSIRDFLYSDIDVEVDIYEILGENKRLNKENKTLRADFDRLMELAKLEKQLTHGKKLNENQLEMVAGHIRNLGNSNYSKPKLINKLREVYTHIATSDDLAWDDLFARFYGIAEDVLGEARPVRSPNGYYANIYRDLRNTEISLSDDQKQYFKDMMGVDYHKAYFGKIKVSDKGIPLNSKWEEWAVKYPNEFAETNDKDQVLELLDIYETAKELKEVVEEYDKVEQARWLANEIYNQYWNVSTIRTTADKHDAQIKRLKYEHRNAMKELRDSYNERVEKQKQIDRAERSRIFKKLREDHIKELQEIRKSGKERMDKYKEDAARKTRIHSITAQALTLNEWLVKNSKDKHIHESMKGPVIALLQAIDFSSRRALGMWGGDMSGVPTNKDISLQKALSQVQKMMADASVGKEELVLLYGHELDADIEAMIVSVDNIMRTVGDNEFILNKMTLDDLITLDNVVKTIKHAVTQMNKFHIVNHAKGIANLAQEEIAHAEKLGKEKIYKDGSKKGAVRKLLAWKNINPYYAFKRFGDAGKKIFEAFQDGYDKFAFNIKQIIDFTNSAYKREEVREWEKEIKTFKLRMPVTEQELSNPDYEQQYQEVQMTVAQIMDLYLLNKREAAKGHLLGGGIRVADIETKKGEVISQSEGAILAQDEIDKIINTLTPRQIEVANALSKFMNTTSSDWGNEVSMARFGYKAFEEKNYVPMQVDKNNLAVDDETEKNNSLFRLLNMSFTKSLTEGANNRLVVSSIFDVFAQHASDMAKYNALALPVLDAFRWYNYKEKGFKGETAFVTKSVKQAIENAFGKEGQSYITTFLKDLNGQENTSRDTLGKSFFTNAKIAAVGANIRVVLLQPTAFLRASANIAPKHLFKGVSLLNLKKSIGLAEKYCGMALWKSLGYFDTNVQRGVADQIKHAESPYEKAIEMSMKGAEWADKVTFGWLWNAAENEIKETRKDLKVGSEEYYTEVGKRLRDIIYSTQVVDSVMTRSEMMRSPDRFDKFLTTFASEPTISYSMLADAYFQTKLDAREMGSKKAAITKNAKHIARVFTAYTVTNLAAALVESVFDILRDNDDDDEEDAWELVKLYLENFLTNQSIAAKIPRLKEAVSIAQGFSSSRLDTQGMQAFANAVKQILKLAQGEGSWGKTVKSGLQSVSYLSGLPFYNAYRDSLAFFDWLTPEELDELLKDFY